MILVNEQFSLHHMFFLQGETIHAKRSHHVHRESLEILTLIQKREEFTPLDFMKI